MKKLLLLLFLIPNLVMADEVIDRIEKDNEIKRLKKEYDERLLDAEISLQQHNERKEARQIEFQKLLNEDKPYLAYPPQPKKQGYGSVFPYLHRFNQDKKTNRKEQKEYVVRGDDKLLPAASGSGFAISDNGYILTNLHVINGCNALNIHTNGKVFPAKFVASDPVNDLAIIKGEFEPKTIFLLRPESPKLLDDIYVAGYPFGYAISSSIKITKGIVSSLSGIGNNYSNIQIDASIQPGNSGGPVLDKEGNVIGIAVAKLNMQTVLKDYGVIPENTNFAIKSNVAKNFAESNNIPLMKKSFYHNDRPDDLGEYISNGTYYLSCMMTLASIKKMQTQKVFFQNITK